MKDIDWSYYEGCMHFWLWDTLLQTIFEYLTKNGNMKIALDAGNLLEIIFEDMRVLNEAPISGLKKSL